MKLKLESDGYNIWILDSGGARDFFICRDGMEAFRAYFNRDKPPSVVDCRFKNPKEKGFKVVKVTKFSPIDGPTHLSVMPSDCIEIKFCNFLKKHLQGDKFWVKVLE